MQPLASTFCFLLKDLTSIVTKPIFSLDISKGAASALLAHFVLAHVSDEGCFHETNELRQPLGIYNISVSRACDKVIRLCRRLETYFNAEGTLEPRSENDEVMQEIVDYIELSLYAAAEHVDDIESIATGFFRHSSFRDKSPAYRELAKAIKQHKRFVSSAANAIKHQQARIRVFSMEYMHAGHNGMLHGYFIEGVEQGVICPSRTFHKDQEVFSVTTLPWEILLFLLRCSHDLATFLLTIAKQIEGPFKSDFDPFSRAAIAAARLPLYTFGEEHPFSRATFRLYASGDPLESLESGLYGSIRTGWFRTGDAKFGRSTSRFVGDGKSCRYRIAQPKSVAFQHWD